jgi:DNA polymerase type B, organellar and viral
VPNKKIQEQFGEDGEADYEPPDFDININDEDTASCSSSLGSDTTTIETVCQQDMFFYYDIETKFVDEGYHVPNLIVCQTPTELLTFKGETMAQDFFKMISQQLSSTRKRLVFIAHNASGFDNTIILQEIYRNGLKPNKIFYRGSKILLLEVSRRLRFLCSYLFLPFSLRDLAKNFGLECEKLYFPYLMNRDQYLTQLVPFPSAAMFNPDSLKPAALKEFQNVYQETKQTFEQSGKLFDVSQELETYCQRDVIVLSKACEAFSHNFEEMTGVSPFSTAITLPSVCLKYYRMHHLPSSTLLPVFSNHGIETKTRYSKIACLWLDYESEKRGGIYIKAAHTCGEVKLGRYTVDGFHRDHITQKCTIFEFYGYFLYFFYTVTFLFNFYLFKDVFTIRVHDVFLTLLA